MKENAPLVRCTGAPSSSDSVTSVLPTDPVPTLFDYCPFIPVEEPSCVLLSGVLLNVQ